MGNNNTKESRQGEDGQHGRGDPRADGSRIRGRVTRSELGGFLAFQASRERVAATSNRADAPFEHRETKQEREARRLEKERASRIKEREHSLKEEHVDGGYLVTMGVYSGTEDFSKPTIRQLQIERRLAPFWRGLNDWSSSWAEHQLVAAARGLPIPAADDPPDPALVPPPPPARENQNLQNLTVPMGPRTMSAASDRSASGSGAPSPTTASAAKSIVKPRAKALAAALSISSRNASSTDLTPKEITLPYDPYVNGQPLEVNLYKDAIDCPICFLSYPPYLNQTRCCDQPICSECFVQIKRADPHLPEHHPDGEARDPNEGLRAEDPPEMLISEPSACPYCAQPEFGVTYEPPPFRRGLVYSASTSHLASSTAMSSQTSLNSTIPPASPAQTGRRRGHSLSATAPNVITTDRVRPDWATKLASARAHQARRAAAATALHTAAFLVGGSENRSMLRSGRFGRRSNGTNTPGQEPAGSTEGDQGEQTVPGRNADGTRRSRMDELEDMMLMEAVRLSIAAEEERQRKEEKALRKEAKKRLQAERKAQKKQGKSPYGENGSGASGSSLSLGLGRKRGNSGASALRVEATISAATQGSLASDSPPTSQPGTPGESPGAKGKGVDRGADCGEGEPSSALPIPNATRGGSHLRQLSNASSLGSSLADTPQGSYTGTGFVGPDGTTSRDGDGERSNDSEPLFNFRSLAELVGVNLDDGSTREEDGEAATGPIESVGRPLSQVREEKESMEAEHVESAHVERDDETTQVPTVSQIGETEAGTSLFPKVTITPGTPLPTDDVEAEGKQLGHTATTEHSQVAQ